MKAHFRKNLPLLAVLLVIVAALILVLADRWRRGSFVLGAATMLAACFRLCVPENRIGLLAVRGKAFDVSALALVGGTIMFLSASIDPLGTG